MPHIVGEVVDAADVRGPDRVHEHVQLAPSLVEERERGFDLAGVEQVALEPDRVVGAEREQLLLRLAEVFRRAGEHRDACAFACQETGGRPPHTTRSAGDHGRPPLQPELHVQPTISGRELARQVRRAQRLAGRADHEVVPPQRRARREDVAYEQLAGGVPVDEAAGTFGERRVEL